MVKAADEIGQHTLGDNFSNDAIANITVSWDAAWGRRGFASLNGMCTLISGRKVIDTEVLTKYCHSCNLWEHKKNSSNYDTTYKCPINHNGSTRSMEAAGIIRMFSRSER